MQQLNNSAYPISVMPKYYYEMKLYIKTLRLSCDKIDVCRH